MIIHSQKFEEIVEALKKEYDAVDAKLEEIEEDTEGSVYFVIKFVNSGGTRIETIIT